MYWHVEAAYQRTSVSGAALSVLVYLAHRADEEGQCWPSQKTIAAHTRVARRTVQRAIEDLQAAGLVDVITGNGRGNTTVYQIKGDTVTPINSRKGDAVTPIDADLVDEKGDIDDIKGDIDDIKGDIDDIKGDIDDNGKYQEKKKNNQEEGSSIAPAREAPPLRGGIRHEMPPPEFPARPPDPVEQLVDVFRDEFTAVPLRGAAQEEHWLAPLGGLLAQCGGDVGEAAEIVRRTKAEWLGRTKPDGRRWPAARPSQIAWLMTEIVQNGSNPAPARPAPSTPGTRGLELARRMLADLQEQTA